MPQTYSPSPAPRSVLAGLIATLCLFCGSATPALSQTADLSLALSQNQPSPARYSIYEVAATLTNDGPDAAAGVRVALPLPEGVVYEGGDEFVASQGTFSPNGRRVWEVGTLDAGAEATITLRLFLLAPSAPDYYGQVAASGAADPDSSPGNGTPGEVNEDDEASVRLGTGGGGNPSGGVDLELAIEQPADPARYAVYETTVTVANAGSATATGVVVRVPRPEGVVYEGGNEASASQGRFTTFGEARGRWTVGTLAPGASATLTIRNYLLAPAAPAGYAQVTALDQDDVDSTPDNGTPPAVNEDDEASTAASPTPRPDLRIADLTVDGPVAPGEPLPFAYVLVNDGAATAAGDFEVTAFISTDENLSGDDLEEGTVSTGDIAGPSRNPVTSVASTGALAPGGYFLIVVADGTAAIAEGDEGNNVAVAPFTVTADAGDDPCAAFANAGDGDPVPSASKTPDNVITVISAAGDTVASFDGPAVVGVTPVQADQFFPTDVAAVPGGGYVLIGAYRPAANPSSLLPFAVRLDAGGEVNAAGPIERASIDIVTFEIVDVDDDGTAYLYELSLFRSASIFPIGLDNEVLWTGQGLGDLVTNEIGGVALSGDEQTVFFSFRDGNSPSWPRLRGIDAATGATTFEVRLGELAFPDADFVSGSSSRPLALPGGGAAVAFLASAQGGGSGWFAARVDGDGSLLDLTELPPLPGGFSGEYAPADANAAGDVYYVAEPIFTSETALPPPAVVTTGGEVVDCSGAGERSYDLHLTARPSNTRPARFSITSVTYTLTNAGSAPFAGAGVDAEVFIDLPAGTVYEGGNEFSATAGTFSLLPFGTGVWRVPDLLAGESESITVNYFARQDGGYRAYAEVVGAEAPGDLAEADSTPDNGDGVTAREDDEVALDLRYPTTASRVALALDGGEVGVRGVARVRLTVDVSAGPTEVVVADVSGRVAGRTAVDLLPGDNLVEIPVAELAPGVYVVAAPATGAAPVKLVLR